MTDDEFLTEFRRRLGGPDTPAGEAFEQMLREAGIVGDEPAEEEKRAA